MGNLLSKEPRLRLHLRAVINRPRTMPIRFRPMKQEANSLTTRRGLFSGDQRFVDLDPQILLDTVVMLIEDRVRNGVKGHHRVSLLMQDLTSLAKTSRGCFALARYGMQYLRSRLPNAVPRPIEEPNVNLDMVVVGPQGLERTRLRKVLIDLKIKLEESRMSQKGTLVNCFSPDHLTL